MDGKITLELSYTIFMDGTVRLRHPDLEGELSFKSSSDRLAQVQLDAINVNRPKTPIEEIVADGQELIEAIRGLNELIPEVVNAAKAKLGGK